MIKDKVSGSVPLLVPLDHNTKLKKFKRKTNYQSVVFIYLSTYQSCSVFTVLACGVKLFHLGGIINKYCSCVVYITLWLCYLLMNKCGHEITMNSIFRNKILSYETSLSDLYGSSCQNLCCRQAI
jgi:amino acid permease